MDLKAAFYDIVTTIIIMINYYNDYYYFYYSLFYLLTKYYLLFLAEEGGEFQETDWVDHFSTQLIDINNLEPEVYEFKTVGKNAVGTSPDSDVIEARPELGPVVRGKKLKHSISCHT